MIYRIIPSQVYYISNTLKDLSSIPSLKRLTSLNVAQNRLVSLGYSFDWAEMSCLKEIDARKNQIIVPFKDDGASVKFPALTRLDLSFNHLNSVTQFIQTPALRDLSW